MATGCIYNPPKRADAAKLRTAAETTQGTAALVRWWVRWAWPRHGKAARCLNEGNDRLQWSNEPSSRLKVKLSKM